MAKKNISNMNRITCEIRSWSTQFEKYTFNVSRKYVELNQSGRTDSALRSRHMLYLHCMHEARTLSVCVYSRCQDMQITGRRTQAHRSCNTALYMLSFVPELFYVYNNNIDTHAHVRNALRPSRHSLYMRC